ncbi:phosphatidylglycerol/phosphatidylinositol transfer protein [Moesziomyces antarcticus]|uniref:Phosphatidylglycerol/phosphatidylinositol transfer protein n=2 Tax=Pseudozyma antarctica TaxID=84753 RepID=A0A5C3FTV8_PSEA2|nr:phosphatidylglycerol/phosphatidylinositol transfer protein [Moesziomyces antarcticus]GAK66636.1 phosphatidylglycerol/phosphatidylinositol transfer protein [Moesziomyces antarcticus]SPO47686.1 Phosphatidylglycerol/phosphatidylinositol transfer protein [Moesziomyces antarcticus]
MQSRFIALTLASLTLASQALAWGCIGQDCNDAANQIAFSVPQPEQAHKSAWDPTPGGGWQWSSCGTGDEVVSVDSIVVSPDPPVPGQNLTVRAKGTIKDEVSDGTFADVVVKLGLIRLLARRFDVCEEARANNADLQCPLSAGDYELEQTVALPREIPPGKFNVHVTGENQDGSNLVCLDLSIQFGFRR